MLNFIWPGFIYVHPVEKKLAIHFPKEEEGTSVCMFSRWSPSNRQGRQRWPYEVKPSRRWLRDAIQTSVVFASRGKRWIPWWLPVSAQVGSLPIPDLVGDGPARMTDHFSQGDSGQVHRACIERSLLQSGESTCESCGYQFRLRTRAKVKTWHSSTHFPLFCCG